jgi:hypothetical protein
MEIAKSLFLGVWLFSFGTIGYLYLALIRKLPSGTAISSGVYARYTVFNAVWWIGLVLCLALGFGIVRRLHVKPIIWVALVVTEKFPVGILSLFLILMIKAREAAR